MMKCPQIFRDSIRLMMPLAKGAHQQPAVYQHSAASQPLLACSWRCLRNGFICILRSPLWLLLMVLTALTKPAPCPLFTHPRQGVRCCPGSSAAERPPVAGIEAPGPLPMIGPGPVAQPAELVTALAAGHVHAALVLFNGPVALGAGLGVGQDPVEVFTLSTVLRDPLANCVTGDLIGAGTTAAHAAHVAANLQAEHHADIDVCRSSPSLPQVCPAREGQSNGMICCSHQDGPAESSRSIVSGKGADHTAQLQRHALCQDAAALSAAEQTLGRDNMTTVFALPCCLQPGKQPPLACWCAAQESQ